MRTLWRVLHGLRSYWPGLIGAILCTMVFAVLSSATIWMMVPFLENIFGTREAPTVEQTAPSGLRAVGPASSGRLQQLKVDLRARTDQWVGRGTRQDALRRICVFILLAFFLKNLFEYGQNYLMVHVEQGLIKRFRDQLYEHLQALSLSYFHRHRTGHLISRVVNDVTLLNEAINVALINLLQDPLMVAMYLALLVVLNWKLTLVVVLVLPIGAWLFSLIGRRLRKYSLRSQERIADVTTVLEETVSGIRVVKAFAMEHFEIERFRRATDRFRRARVKLRRVRLLASPITEFMGSGLAVAILWVGGRQVLTDQLMAPEEFITFLVAMFLMMRPLKSLGNVYNQLQVGIAAGDRIFEVLDTTPAIQEREDARKIEAVREEIRYNNVTFAYDGEPTLCDVSLTVKVGEVLAIAGPSGGGKSTLVDLLPRLYDPTHGAITIDGVDLRALRIADLRRLMGIVTQETILFNDTVRNNVAYGHPEISDERIVAAARVANAHDFILQMPEGYQTVIGDRGVRLSGGQRQRLAIARAVLKDPPILIFDEATSSLDSESEQLVQQAIDRLMQGRTVFVIAHRLSTIQNADRIIVMDQGRIVQEGTHRELVAQEGLFRKLHEMQFGNGARGSC